MAEERLRSRGRRWLSLISDLSQVGGVLWLCVGGSLIGAGAAIIAWLNQNPELVIFALGFLGAFLLMVGAFSLLAYLHTPSRLQLLANSLGETVTTLSNTRAILAPVDHKLQTSDLASPKEVPAEILAGRVMVPASTTPEYLWKQFDGKTNLQGQKAVADYTGYWLSVTGKVDNVFSKTALLEVGQPSKNIEVSFSDAWLANLAMIQRGESLDVLGKITRIDTYVIYLEDCELLGQSPIDLSLSAAARQRSPPSITQSQAQAEDRPQSARNQLKLSPTELRERLLSGPLLVQKQVAKGFEGLFVELTGTASAIDETKDGVSLYYVWEDKQTFFLVKCELSASTPGVGALMNGSKVTIAGHINSIDARVIILGNAPLVSFDKI